MQIGCRREEHERDALDRTLRGQNIIGTLPYCAELARADLEGRPVEVEDRAFGDAINRIGEALEKHLK